MVSGYMRILSSVSKNVEMQYSCTKIFTKYVSVSSPDSHKWVTTIIKKATLLLSVKSPTFFPEQSVLN